MEFCNSPENANHKGFVCVKSDFNLAILIDVAFYFKCLLRDATTDLCGPVSNVTHAHVRLSKPSDQWPACNVCHGEQFSRSPSAWLARRREAGLLPRTTNLQMWVLWRLSALVHDSTGQLCWCCQPHPPAVHLLWLIQRASGGLAHQRRGWRVQEQVFRGQPGVLHLISSQVQINLVWCIILNEPVCTDVSLSS